MIAKITQGASGTALIRYLFGPGRANEHSEQRVVASGIVMGVEEARPLTPLEMADLGAALDGANDLYRSDPAGGHIWHLSLSLPAGESVSDEQWAQIAQRAVEAVGFEGEGVEPAAWVAIGHGNSAQGLERMSHATTKGPHPAQRRYPPEIRERGVRMVHQLRREDPADQGVINRWPVSWAS